MDSDLIESIAYKTFIDRNSGLEYELSDDELTFLTTVSCDGIRIDGRCLIFESLDIIQKIVANYCYKEITLQNNDVDDLIASKAFLLWECGLFKKATASGLFLSLFEDYINILPLLFVSNKNSYEVSSVADQYFHHSKDIKTGDVIVFFNSLYHKYDKPIDSFDELGVRLSSDRKKCTKIISYIRDDTNFKNTLLYNIALLALSKNNYQDAVDIALYDANSNDDRIIPQALWILGLLLKNDANTYKRVDVLHKLKKSSVSSSSAISEISIEAIINALEFSDELRQYISELLNSNSSTILKLSKKLTFSKELKESKEFPLWMDCICKNVSNNIELLSNVSHILASLIERQQFHSLFSSCLTELMSVDNIENQHDTLDYLMRSILRNESLANKLLTQALSDERPQVAKMAVMILLSATINGQEYKPHFDISIIEIFDKDSFIFLIRKMLGYITDKEYLFSLSISLLSVSNYQSRTSSFVKQIILNEILVDYPLFIKNKIFMLKEKCDKRKRFLIEYYDEIMECVNSYVDDLNKFSMAKEFEPSSISLSAFLKERNKKMERDNEIQNKNSIISKIATRIPIKAGTGTFYYNDFNNDGYSQPSMLHTFSSSYSLPRRYIIDNVGHEITTIMYKKAQKGEL